MTGRAEYKSKPHYHGHRQRLRERFLTAGPEGLSDYELIELLLFLAQPRGDMKPLAKTLLAEFGSFAKVVTASPEELNKVAGCGPAAVVALKTTQAAAVKLLKEEAQERPVISSWEKLLAYCRAAMAHEKVEQFRLLFLDKKNRLIADEVQQRGTVDHTPLYPREVVKRALELGASAIIMVHNHPSGDPTPSGADIEMTKHVREAAEKLGVAVHDHVIIGRDDHTSFRSIGLL